MSIPKPVRLLTQHARPIILTRFRRDSCIASTAISIKVLQHFGIHAWALPVHMTAFNQTYIEMMEKLQGREGDEVPVEEQQYWLDRGAWSIEVEDSSVGHVVACTKKVLIDMSIDQATRPAKNIFLEPLTMELRPGFFEGELNFTEMNETLVAYQANPGRTTFLESKDWTDALRHDRLVDEIIEVMEKEMRKRKPR